jgi:hypothetical protein
MPRHIWSVLAVVAILGSASPAGAQAPGRPAYQQAALVISSTLQGLVRDEQGRGLGGTMVSVLEVSKNVSRMVVSDARGRFTLTGLPPGNYVLRANRDGYSSRRDQVLIPASQALEHNITLVKQPAARPVMLAGMGGTTTASNQPPGSSASTAATSADDHTHDELAWLLRQLTRTALRDVGPMAVPDSQPRSFTPKGSSILDWAFLNSARAATSFLTTTPFTGQINLLTSGSISGSPGLAPVVPRGIAYGVVGAPVGASGDWTMRAAMNSGDWSSWAVLGEYRARASQAHAFRIGLSYAEQSFEGSAPSASTSPATSRSAAGVYAFDRWRLSPQLQFDYGLRVDQFGYVPHGALLSPRAGARVGVMPATFLVVSASQRMVAPGAEEFLPPVDGPWLPPERTFEPLGSATFVAERVRHDELGLEHDFGGRSLGVRYFRESTDNQLVNVFAGDGATVVALTPGHFGVANAGAVDIGGWDVRASGDFTSRLHGRIDYVSAQARWLPGDAGALLLLLGPTALPGSTGRVHDLTTSLEATVPETATRLTIVFEFDDAFSQPNLAKAQTGPGSRFDVQVNQGLPFRPVGGGSRMELLVAVRNMFRDLREPGSMFDELLTVAPPLRVIGGLQIRF